MTTTAEEGGLEYVPEYLPEGTKRRLIARSRARVARRSRRRLRSTKYLIRHWCETLEELYLDVGSEARKMQGREAPRRNRDAPLVDGVVADFEIGPSHARSLFCAGSAQRHLISVVGPSCRRSFRSDSSGAAGAPVGG